MSNKFSKMRSSFGDASMIRIETKGWKQWHAVLVGLVAKKEINGHIEL